MQDSNSKEYTNSVRLDDEEGVVGVVSESILGFWDVVNNLTRLRPVQWRGFRVTIFGSARAEPTTFAYEQVKQLGRELAEMGCEIVSGGGPGLMQAANEGASEAGEEARARSIGVRIRLDFEQATNPFVSQAYEHRSFFSRLHHFILLSHAFVVVPGGIGTTLEALMIWQLLQVRHMHGTPLIMIGKMWPELIRWAESTMLTTKPPLANPEDMSIPQCVENAEAAVGIIRKHYDEWRHERERTMGSRPHPDQAIS
jgi:uncharacterized protein (TIGR00730 family)